MTRISSMTLDEALRPIEMTCVTCGGKLVCYPREWTGQEEQSINYCSNCSPAWVEDFARHLMNELRTSRGLQKIETVPEGEGAPY